MERPVLKRWVLEWWRCSRRGEGFIHWAKNGEERFLLLNQFLQLDMVENAHKPSSQDPKAGESQVQDQLMLHINSRSAWSTQKDPVSKAQNKTRNKWMKLVLSPYIQVGIMRKRWPGNGRIIHGTSGTRLAILRADKPPLSMAFLVWCFQSWWL